MTDETGTPVAGASVSAACRDGASAAVTGPDGTFQIRVSEVIGQCHVVISRLGFDALAVDLPVGRMMITSRMVMKKSADGAIALSTRERSTLFQAAAPSPRWQTSTTYSGQAATAGLARTFDRLAGGARWETEWQAKYVTRSGFSIAGSALGRRGYGMPLFMSRPFLDERTMPDFSPPQTAESQWNAMVTATTPPVHFGSATLAAAVQAFTQVGAGGGTAVAPKPDRGVRGVLHIRFK